MSTSSLRVWIGVAAGFLGWVVSGVAAGSLAPTHLRCEYLENPMAVDAVPPRLSYEVVSDRRGDRQTARHILVASKREKLAAGDGDVWDSGVMSSGETLHVEYGGRPLRSREQVWWKVRVKGVDGGFSAWSEPATWRMGLLERSDWAGRWISHGAEVARSQPGRNGYHSQLRDGPGGLHWVTVTFDRAVALDEVVLWPARPFNWTQDSPGFLFPVRFGIGGFESGSEFSFTNFDAAPFPNPGTNAVRLRVAPQPTTRVTLAVTEMGRRSDGRYGIALAEIEAWSGGANVALGARVETGSTIEDAAWSTNCLTDGDVISHAPVRTEAQPATWLRREFEVRGRVVRAILYATALGVYEARVNGRRVGHHVLAPEWTDYHRRVQYQAYDVTEHVVEGTNCVSVILGDGWYAGRLGMSDGLIGVLRGVYGPKPWFLGQLELTLADGRRVVVASDDAWRVSRDGPIRSSDLLDGEEYDARREMPGWDQAGFDSKDWAPATTRMIEVPPRLVAQPSEPIRVIEELRPVAHWSAGQGTNVYDFGQNLVGHCRVSIQGRAGEVVRFRHAEMTNADGSIYVANLRGAPQVDQYVVGAGSGGWYEPLFTQHGFRFLEVTGLERAPETSRVVARVFNSAAREVGEFECSDPMLTRLWRNIRWTQRANLVSVPTDCPQRDERLGWMGDIQAFAQTAIYQMDLGAFFTKWVPDVRDAQAVDGRFPDFAPHPYGPDDRFSGAPAWADAGVIVPWRCYQNYGDRRLLEQHFEAARRWVEFVHARNPDGLWRQARGNDYNDWLNGDTLRREGWPTKGAAVPQEVLATAFHAHTLGLVSEMARVLGRSDDAARYAQLASASETAFNSQLVEAPALVRGDTQAGYALAIEMGLLPGDRVAPAVANLVSALDRYQGRLATGIQTTHRMLQALSRHGRPDLAWRLVTSHEFPSWGYMIDNGATTIWERWDGFVAGRGFQDAGMNSFNHWALGSVGEWLMEHAAGIAREEGTPAWATIRLAPSPGGGVTWARGHYHSIRGLIASEWRLADWRMHWTVVVPANTTARVWFPGDARVADVKEGERSLREVQGILETGDGGGAWARVGAGRYRFDFPLGEGGR